MIINVKIILAFLFSLSAFKSDNVIIKLDDVPDFYTCDNFDNVYIYSGNYLKKYKSDGNQEAQFSTLTYGNVQRVDVSDPFRIVLFYKDYNTILMLDNKLNQLGEPVRLTDLGLSTVDAVCKSKENGIWLFDSFAQKIRFFNLSNNGFSRIIDLAKRTKPVYNIENLVEIGSELYFYRSNAALLSIDQLGGQLKIYDVYPSLYAQIRNNNLIYNNNQFLYKFNLQTEVKDSVKIEGFENFDDVRLGNSKIFVLKDKTITIMEKPEGF